MQNLYKILVVGESNVGKTCLLLRYVDDNYSDKNSSTIGVDFKSKAIDINGELVKLQIWDTAGAEKFQSITKAYFRGALGILVVFDLTDNDTFEKVSNWIDSINEIHEKISIILVGNKSDLDHKVSREKVESIAEKYKIKYFETSAKDNSNVYEVFQCLANDIHSRLENPNEPSNVIKIDHDDNKKNGCC